MCSTSSCECTSGYYESSNTSCSIVPAGSSPTGPGSIVASGDGSKIYAILYRTEGYIFRSTNNGSTWNAETKAGYGNWFSLAISNTGSHVYAGSYLGYIFVTLDSGGSWAPQLQPGYRTWYGLATSSDGSKVYASALNDYIYSSADAGSTWTQQRAAGARNWYDITTSSGGGSYVFACLYQGGSLYSSSDSGVTWTERTAAGSRNWKSVVSSSDGSTVYAISWLGYIYYSSNYAVTWTALIGAEQRPWVAIATSSDGSKVVAASVELYTSSDYGTSWTVRAGAGSRSWNSLSTTSDGSKIFADGGGTHFLYSNDSGLTWSELTHPLKALGTATQSGAVAYTACPAGRYSPAAGSVECTDCPLLATSIVGVSVCVQTLHGACTFDAECSGVNQICSSSVCKCDTGYYDIDSTTCSIVPAGYNPVSTTSASSVPSTSQYYYAVCASSDGKYVYVITSNPVIFLRSSDFGLTYTSSTPFPTNVGNYNYQVYYYSCACSSDGSRVYTGYTYQYGSGLYTSGNYGQSFGSAGNGNAWQGFASSSNGQYVYAAGLTKTYRSVNYGGSYVVCGFNSEYRAIATSSDGSKVYAAAGYSSSTGGKIYSSADYGVTWAQTSAGTDVSWYAIATSDDGSKVYAAGTSSSVWYSSDSGGTWVERTASGTGSWKGLATSGDGSKVYGVLGGMKFSLNYGLAWTLVEGGQSLNTVATTSDGSRVYAVRGTSSYAGGGVYYLVDYSTSLYTYPHPISPSGNVATVGAVAYTPCAVGKYSSVAGSTTCTDCPSGFTSGLGSSSITSCTGPVCALGGGNCYSGGQYCNGDTLRCTICLADSYCVAGAVSVVFLCIFCYLAFRMTSTRDVSFTTTSF